MAAILVGGAEHAQHPHVFHIWQDMLGVGMSYAEALPLLSFAEIDTGSSEILFGSEVSIVVKQVVIESFLAEIDQAYLIHRIATIQGDHLMDPAIGKLLLLIIGVCVKVIVFRNGLPHMVAVAGDRYVLVGGLRVVGLLAVFERFLLELLGERGLAVPEVGRFVERGLEGIAGIVLEHEHAIFIFDNADLVFFNAFGALGHDDGAPAVGKVGFVGAEREDGFVGGLVL